MGVESKKAEPSKAHLSRKFDSVEEAAQAKIDHVWNTVFKNVDWNKFEEMRKKETEKR